MGKLAVAGATALVGGGTAVGGMALSKMFSFDSTLPKDLDGFKDGNGGGCVQSLFPGLQSMGDSGVEEVSSTDDSKKIKSGFFDTSKKSETIGCLVVNGDREEYKVDSDNKGKGSFRLLWAVKQESKGFVVFTTATTTDDSDKKLLWKGLAYSLTKTGEDWQLSKKKVVDSTDKKTNKDSTDVKFPKPHTDLTSKPFWGFMSEKGDMDKMCDSTTSCSDDKKVSSSAFEGYGTWQGTSSGKNLGDGTSNNLSDASNSGWDFIYTKSEGDMAEVVKDMTGKGEEKVGHGIAKPKTTVATDA